MSNTRQSGNYWVKLSIHSRSKWFVLNWYNGYWWNGVHIIDGVGPQAINGLSIDRIIETPIPEPEDIEQ